MLVRHHPQQPDTYDWLRLALIVILSLGALMAIVALYFLAVPPMATPMFV
jgi:hypothetical protein